MRRALLPLLLSSLALVGAGCGREGGPGARSGPRSEPTVVAKRAYEALARGDLASLEAEMDAEGRRALAADLKALRPGLAEPADAVPGVADEVRGVFAAQLIKPQARTLAGTRGIDCVLVDYDALRGLDNAEDRLF